MSTVTEDDNGIPRGAYKGALFLHIPKTAGSALTDTFCFAYPHFLRDAHLPDSNWRNVVEGNENFFVSGHFSFSDVADAIARPDVFSFTVLRDPLEQVVSNIKWVKAYGDPARAAQRTEISPSIAELAQQLWFVSLDDVNALSTLLEGARAQPFRNVQTMLLSAGAGQGAGTGADLLDIAFANLQRFTLFFALEDIALGFDKMNRIVGPLEPLKHSNEAVLAERPDLTDQAIRGFYASLIDLDLRLYARVKQDSRARMETAL